MLYYMVSWRKREDKMSDYMVNIYLQVRSDEEDAVIIADKESEPRMIWTHNICIYTPSMDLYAERELDTIVDCIASNYFSSSGGERPRIRIHSDVPFDKQKVNKNIEIENIPLDRIDLKNIESMVDDIYGLMEQGEY